MKKNPFNYIRFQGLLQDYEAWKKIEEEVVEVEKENLDEEKN